jgi:hypothetical protein
MDTTIRAEFNGNLRSDYMIGIEVEKTVALYQETLFVQGLKNADIIKNTATGNNIKHIYLGANRSFNINHDWDALISSLLDSGFLVTLDYNVICHSAVMKLLSSKIWKCNNFIPMISVDVTNMCGLNDNLVIKIDDPNLVSKGVWCWNQAALARPAKFTSWEEYSGDRIIKEIV